MRGLVRWRRLHSPALVLTASLRRPPTRARSLALETRAEKTRCDSVVPYIQSTRHASRFRCSECDDARGAWHHTHALRTLPADDCSGPAPGTQPYRTSLHNSTRACMSVPSVRPSEGSPCRTPPALRTLGLAASHARPRTHGTPHAREIDRACSPLVAAPALPAASRRVPHSFASGLLQSRVRLPPRPQLDPTESRRYLGCRPWTRRNLGGIWAAALPPPPRLFGSSRCAPPTEPQCVPCAPCRNGVPLPTRLPRMYPNEAVRTPAWRMPY